MKKLLFAIIFLCFLNSNSWATDSGDGKTSICLYCYTPYYFTTTAVKATSAVLAFDGYAQTGTYELEYGKLGFITGTGTKLTPTSLEQTLTGLIPNTDYTALLRFKCSTGEVSTDFALNFKTTFKIDVGISQVISPISKCDLGNNERLTVQVKNYGEIPQSLIDLRFSVNGQPISVPQFVDGYYTGVLSIDSSDAFIFDTGYDYSQEGEYKVASWTELKGDENINNDTTYYSLFHVPTINNLPYTEAFEPSTGGWTSRTEVGTAGWQLGVPNQTYINTTASGDNSFFINIPTNFSEQVLSYLESPCFDFSSSTTDPYFSFNLNYYTDTYYNGIWVETSDDSGVSWKQLGTFNEPINWYNQQSNIFGFPAWGGSSNGWSLVGHKLPGLKGKPNCRIRIVFNTYYNFTTGGGVAVDNILIYKQIAKDLTSASIKNTSVSECGSTKDKLQITLVNTGAQSIVGPNQIKASFIINNKPVVTENLPSIVLLPSNAYTYTFTTPFDSYGPGTYNVKSWVTTPGDANNFNDTIYYTIKIAEPGSLPVKEDFESALFPKGWESTYFSVTNSHNNKSFVMAANMYAFSTPEIDFTTNSLGPLDGSNILTFDYRYVNYYDGLIATPASDVHLDVELSDDCGETFKNIYTIDDSNHVPSTDLKNISLDLSAYAGKIIKLRFKSIYTGTGDFWVDVDNININGCPVNLGATPTINYVSALKNGSIKLNPVKGTGPYTYLWSTGSTSSSVSNLSAGNYCVTINDAKGCNDIQCFDVLDCPASLGFSGTISSITEPGKKDGKVVLSGPAGNFTYAWSNGATGKSISFLDKGNYSVTISNTFGCQQILNFSVFAVGVTEIESLSQLNINPNPTYNSINLNAVFTKVLDIDVKLSNVLGKLLYSKKYLNSSYINEAIDLSSYPAGIYILQLSAANQATTKKIVKIQ
ncbi:MAG TPA: T9SS type A sorting domain-containing protein [Saprospiraceae bacterium]|nr:T9SS type A sorting domain-containing protein [Saprospiraceae bacterium]